MVLRQGDELGPDAKFYVLESGEAACYRATGVSAERGKGTGRGCRRGSGHPPPLTLAGQPTKKSAPAHHRTILPGGAPACGGSPAALPWRRCAACMLCCRKPAPPPMLSSAGLPPPGEVPGRR